MNLRPILPRDSPTLFAWASDLRDLYLWSHDRRVPSYQEFLDRLQISVRQTQSYIVEDRATQGAIGFCQAYDLNLVEGWCSVLQYIASPYRAGPHAAEAGLIFFDLLFKYFPLRKIYADVFEYNEHSYNILTRHGGFREEARLPNHIWYEYKYWAMIKLALYREDYYQGRERMHRVLAIQHEVNSVMQRASGAPGPTDS